MPQNEATTIRELLLRRIGDHSGGLKFQDQAWSWNDHMTEAIQRAHWLSEHRTTGPFHVGILLDNVPEFSFFLAACGLTGAVVVGLNPTRRGTELERDIRHTDCQFVITEAAYTDHLAAIDTGLDPRNIVITDDPDWPSRLAEVADWDVPEADVSPEDLFMLIFTSGTTGSPKAVQCSTGSMARRGKSICEVAGLTSDDVLYISMPLFHSNAMLTGWIPSVSLGATLALRHRFSASEFLTDIRKFGATYANYVGKPLSYVLATPERSDDAENSLRLVYGNEASDHDIAEFGRRFDCRVIDAFGMTEGGIRFYRTPDSPPGSLGLPRGDIRVIDAGTGLEAARARFDEAGRLLNPEEAIGEIVNFDGTGSFEGYYRNEEAMLERVRDGKFWSGDLAYRDSNGYFFYAGRTLEWLRVDGENLAVAPIERLLLRFEGVSQAAVYAVPDPSSGDQVMAALVLDSGEVFDPDRFSNWLQAQPDLGTKWSPKFIRVLTEMPKTMTNKIRKNVLRSEAWKCDDVLWWRPTEELAYRRMQDQDQAELQDRFAEFGREHLLSMTGRSLR